MNTGDMINSRYQIEQPLQTAWLARDMIGGQLCLIRQGGDFIDPSVAEWLGRVWHPGLPRMLERIDTIGGDPLFVFEFCEGTPIDRMAENPGKMDHQCRLVSAVAKTARILSFLHNQCDQPMLHLDLKPEHILIGENEQVYLIDFGAAQRMTDSPSDAVATRVKRQALTPEYAAPEQMAGRPCPASDLYSLGLSLLHLLTGLHPSQCRSQPLAEIAANLPFSLQRILGRCLHSDPAARYASAEELASALEQSQQEMISAEPLNSEAAAVIELPETSVPVNDECRQPAPLICIWDGAEFGCELAAALGEKGKVLVIDADLLNPRADLLLGQLQERLAGSGQLMTGLDLAITRQQRGDLDIVALNLLIQTTRVKNVSALTTRAGLEHYEHFDMDSLYQILRLSRMTHDWVIVLCSRFIYDAFTCLTLQTATLVLIPLSGDSAAFRERRRSIEYLAARQQVDQKKISFAVFPYDSSADLSRGTLDELSGGRLAGCISDTHRRRSMKSSAIPYAAGLDRQNQQEYKNIIRKLRLDKTTKRR